MASRAIRGLTVGALLAVSLAANDLAPDPLLEGQHWKRLRALAEPRVKASPGDAHAHYLLSRVKMEYGDLDGALALAEKAASLDPRNGEYRYTVAGVVGRKAERAGVFSQFGLARRFKREAEASLALDAKLIDPRIALMEFHLRAPGIVGGDKSRVPVLLNEIARLDAARGYLAQARAAQIEKKTAGIETFYVKAVEANPANYSARMSLGGFYSQAAPRNYDASEKHFQEALKIDPQRIGAYAALAGLYAFQQRWPELESILAQGEKNVFDNLSPYYNAGRVILTDGKDFPRAEQYFRKYLTQEPEPNAPTLAHAHWRLGLVLEKLGRKAEAVAELEKAVRLKPDLEEARKDLKRLK
jgi:tetratricopeptide (TPR) repeat protein